MNQLAHDIRIALRGFRRTPTFAIAVLAIIVALFLGSLALAEPASAQALRGTLLSSAHGTAVPDAIVVLTDSLGAIQARSRSGDDGTFSMRVVSSGPFRLRIQRIGVRPYETSLFEVHVDTAVTLALDELPAIALAPVLTTARSACTSVGVPAESVWRLWEDVRTALLATSITLAEERDRFDLMEVNRVYDLAPRAMRDIAVSELTVTSTKPWESISADTLATRGYVVLRNGQLTFAAPDLEVLLSKSFENTHCFEPSLLRDRSLTGLVFHPAPTLRNHTDIAGTFWVNSASHQLDHISFRYTGLPLVADDSVLQSIVTFARSRDREWFVSSWSIRAPIPTIVSSRMVLPMAQLSIFAEQVEGRLENPFEWRVNAISERRGDVLSAHTVLSTGDSSQVWSAPTGSIRVKAVTIGAPRDQLLKGGGFNRSLQQHEQDVLPVTDSQEFCAVAC